MSKNIVDRDLLEIVKFWTVRYGKETVEQRALADIRDGLKPVVRRILWAMHNLNIKNNGGFKKSARTIGEVIGKYHPHGDSACYEALVKMVNLPEPLIAGQGNFGSSDDLKSYAAMRYTECKLSKYSDDFILDPEYLAVVPMTDNFDGEFQEPIYLPSKLPNLLINGSEGIASGCSSLIPSFSKKSVTKLVKLGLKGRKIDAKLCAKILKFKFTYGGIVDSSKEEVLELFKTGKTTLKFLPKLEEKGNKIKIIDISPRFNIEKKLLALTKIKEIRQIADNREGDVIEFELTINSTLQGNDRVKVIDKIKSTLRTGLPCQTLVTERLDDGKTVVFSKTNIPDIIKRWLKWRVEFENKVIKRLKCIEKQKLQKQNLLLLAINNKEEIKKSLDNKDPITHLSTKLKINIEDSKWILHLQIIRLAKIEKKKVKEIINNHKMTITGLKSELKNVNRRIFNQLS